MGDLCQRFLHEARVQTMETDNAAHVSFYS
jgi:hypothetical protein